MNPVQNDSPASESLKKCYLQNRDWIQVDSVFICKYESSLVYDHVNANDLYLISSDSSVIDCIISIDKFCEPNYVFLHSLDEGQLSCSFIVLEDEFEEDIFENLVRLNPSKFERCQLTFKDVNTNGTLDLEELMIKHIHLKNDGSKFSRICEY